MRSENHSELSAIHRENLERLESELRTSEEKDAALKELAEALEVEKAKVRKRIELHCKLITPNIETDTIAVTSTERHRSA